MSLRICICESDELNQILLTDIIKYYFRSKHVTVDILKYSSGQSLMDDYKESEIYPDILLMDIELKDMNGLKLCKELRAKKYSGIIVFITTSAEYAIEGYTVDARGFLLKPYNPHEIHQTFDRILQNNGTIAYTLKSYNHTIRVPISEMIYIESQNSKCILHCKENLVYTVYKKLSDIEEELSNPVFLRCHRSYLINMDEVISADRSRFVMTSGEQIPIRRQDAKEILETYRLYSNTSE